MSIISNYDRETARKILRDAGFTLDQIRMFTAEGEKLRDRFATAAMQAAATNPRFTFNQRAEWAYQQADAMMEARNK